MTSELQSASFPKPSSSKGRQACSPASLASIHGYRRLFPRDPPPGLPRHRTHQPLRTPPRTSVQPHAALPFRSPPRHQAGRKITITSIEPTKLLKRITSVVEKTRRIQQKDYQTDTELSISTTFSGIPWPREALAVASAGAFSTADSVKLATSVCRPELKVQWRENFTRRRHKLYGC